MKFGMFLGPFGIINLIIFYLCQVMVQERELSLGHVVKKKQVKADLCLNMHEIISFKHCTINKVTELCSFKFFTND